MAGRVNFPVDRALIGSGACLAAIARVWCVAGRGGGGGNGQGECIRRTQVVVSDAVGG